MDQQKAADIIFQALSEINSEKAEEFKSTPWETRIRELNIDSVLMYELVGEIEDRIGATFEEDDLSEISRFIDLIDLIQNAS